MVNLKKDKKKKSASLKILEILKKWFILNFEY